ncbi:uncharacterized protein LOC110986150 isoform X2 [Acanthaster planci]|uniref:Uncharacterized protein LOC110986150 isoform X2 n=1 Tax=Acanthaster planci TaxID=133434 RepID=A0A8B7ZES7_ACAPL|nr:uncharacterized protein LOC110986150 isoform X2 [Acanthaster planci]
MSVGTRKEDSPSVSRFLSRSKKEIRGLGLKPVNSGTQRSTRHAACIMREFCKETGRGQVPFETLPLAELDSLLEDFFGNIIKRDGTPYNRNGLIGIRYGLARFLKEKRHFDITAHPGFSKSIHAYKARQAELKRKGLDVVNHYPPFTVPDLIKLYSSFDLANPTSLRQKVQFDVMFFLCRRGRDKLREMTKDQFVLDTTPAGQRYVRPSGNQPFNQESVEYAGCTNVMLERRESPLCPVLSFEVYMSKLNPLSNWLWQRERAANEMTGPVWYTHAPVGKNSLATLIPVLSQELGLSMSYTNHSIRVTPLTTYDSALPKVSFVKASQQAVKIPVTPVNICLRNVPSVEPSLDTPARSKQHQECYGTAEQGANPPIGTQEHHQTLSVKTPDEAPGPYRQIASQTATASTDAVCESTPNHLINDNQTTYPCLPATFHVSHSTDTDSSKIYSGHFRPGEVKGSFGGRWRLVRDTIPSVFFFSKADRPSTSSSKDRCKDMTGSEKECAGSGDSQSQTAHHPAHGCVPTSTNDHLQAAVLHIQQLEVQNRQLQNLRFEVGRFCDDPDLIQFYTGFDTYNQFCDAFQALQPTDELMRDGSWSAIRDTTRNENLTPTDQFFLFLCRCRAGLLEQDLAVRFGISIAAVVGILTIWTNYLHFRLAPLLVWPSRECVNVHMPQCIKDICPRLRVILVSTEMKYRASSLYINNRECSQQKTANGRSCNSKKVNYSLLPKPCISLETSQAGGPKPVRM